MRILAGSVVVLVGLVGCEFQPVMFSHEASLFEATRGVVIHDGGDTAQVGMAGTTCEFDTYSQSLGTDYDYPSDDEQVQDIGEDENGDVVVVVTSDKGVHVQKSDSWFIATSDDYSMQGAQDALVLPQGVVVFRETSSGCSVDTVHTDTPTRVNMKNDVCVGHNTLTGDPTTGTIYVGSENGIYVVRDGMPGVFEQDGASELVAWDTYADVLYTAAFNDTVLRALEADGTERWSVELGGAVRDLDAMGTRGAAAVSVAYVDGRGGIVVIDGFTGEVLSNVGNSEPAKEISTSADGRSVAVAGERRVDFYRVMSFF